jgi:histidinol-phosphatase (PHP family)
MPYTHHSHSGSFCKHAHDTLESVINTAIDKKFKIFCLTEHVPRLTQQFVYPEEEELNMTPATLMEQFQSFVTNARNYQNEINLSDKNQTKILVGFESEGGIDDAHLNMCIQLRKEMDADIIVGSVHHVNGIDIDFDQETWNKAFETYNGLRGLYKEYFTLVKRMIKILKPEVVAHFDLIRLFANTIDENKNKITQEEKLNITIKKDWPEVWEIIEDSIDLIVDYDLTVELNSSAIRKGWNTPYPKDDIMNLMMSKNVKFVLSDDSHGNDQVGLNYQIVLNYIKLLNIKNIWYYDIEKFNDKSIRNGKGHVVLKSITIDELTADDFWRSNYPSYFLD